MSILANRHCSISETLRESNLLQRMDLSFPEIAVVGQESTGKSSVLERVLGLPLFPRGADITTRMPIRLRLSHLSATELRTFCAAEKLRESDDGFYIRVKLINTTKPAASEVTDCTPFEGPVHAGDFRVQGDGPCARINAIMQRQTAGPGGVSHGVDEASVLQLEVKSRKLSDLKLLDLPGVVGGSVEGEPTDMDQRTQRLVKKHLACPDTLVLIVAEATASSVRNSSAFSLVAEANKAGKSLGVLTKADGCIGPSLTRLRERLAGRAKDLPTLGHGYVALVNRDSTDERCLTIAAADAVEGEWFEKNLPDFKASNGGEVLVQKLVDLLVSYVRDSWADKALATLRAERANLKVRPLRRVLVHVHIFICTKLLKTFKRIRLTGTFTCRPPHLGSLGARSPDEVVPWGFANTPRFLRVRHAALSDTNGPARLRSGGVGSLPARGVAGEGGRGVISRLVTGVAGDLWPVTDDW